MRISEDRYSQDLRRLELAHRLIQHEVRTQWICAMTGLTDERVRNLLHSYGVGSVPRHRGAPPTSCAVFFRTANHPEASALGALARVWTLVPASLIRNARLSLPGLEWGERLCEAFEFFRALVPGGVLSVNQFILLIFSLAAARVVVAHCAQCQAAILIDPLEAQRLRCRVCAAPVARTGSPRVGRAERRPEESRVEDRVPTGDQQNLF